jgi:sulfofructose kinase
MTVDRDRAVAACGFATMDCEYDVDHAPADDEKVRARSVALRLGGPAARAAAAARHLAVPSALVTCLGGSPVDEWIAARVRAEGVALHVAGRPHATPVASVVVARGRGSRAVTSAIDPAPVLADDVEHRVATAVRGAGCVLVDGHYPDLAHVAARAAAASGVPVLADAGSWRDELAPVLARATVVIAAEPFARDVGGVDAAIELVRGLGVAWVAVTRGPAPIRWAGPGDDGEVVVAPVEARNTNGAGDVVHGAAAAAIARIGAPGASVAFVTVLRAAAFVAGVAVAHDDPLAAIDDDVAARFDARLA